jgi:hypothetical protein
MKSIGFLTLISLSVLLFGQTSHAFFFFCESTLSKEYGLIESDAQNVCDSPYADSLKEAMKKEASSDIKKTIQLILATKSEEDKFTFEELLTKSKKSSDLEIKVIVSYSYYYNLKNTFNLTTDVPVKNLQALELISKEFSNDKKRKMSTMPDINSFILFSKKASTDQINALPAFTKRFSGNDSVKLLLAIDPTKLAYATSLVQNYSDPRLFYDFISLSSKEILQCNIQIGRYSNPICSGFIQKSFCGPKMRMLETLIKSNSQKDLSSTVVEQFLKYNHFGENHARMLIVLNSISNNEDFLELTKELFSRVTISDSSVSSLAAMLNNPFTNKNNLRNIILSNPGFYETSPLEFKSNRTGYVQWGQSIGTACAQGLDDALSDALKQCRTALSHKKDLNCEINGTITSLDTSEKVCIAKATATGTYLRDNIPTCEMDPN